MRHASSERQLVQLLVHLASLGVVALGYEEVLVVMGVDCHEAVSSVVGIGHAFLLAVGEEGLEFRQVDLL